MTPDLEILIIGGGLSGLSAALHLTRAGVEDLFVLEAELIGRAASGTSSATMATARAR
jgi:glycine/D-amino acid oxidase-like deaminating enzyme